MAAISIDAILGISGNRPVFNALTSLMRTHRAIAFVGAGASAPLYPLWDQFVEMLADHAVTKGLATIADAARWKTEKVPTPQQRVDIITRKLGDSRYHEFVQSTFGPRCGVDGKQYTPTHEALLDLPFRGYITTNYDPGLDFARAARRPQCPDTGTPTWQDNDQVHKWLTGDVFENADACPLLWIHGAWQRPEGVILNLGEYANAYRSRPFRNLFDRLWQQDHLVFVGFGFNDPQLTFVVSDILRDLDGACASPRHIAILGIPVDHHGDLPDTAIVQERREALESDYHVRPIFYPVHAFDHSALHTVLESLRPGNMSLTATAASAPIRPPGPAFQSCWVHDATDDERFAGRTYEMDRLANWVRDETVRVIGVRAVGGTGKTALIGHWLKRSTSWNTRPFVGLFAWSFYQDPDPTHFLNALVNWCRSTFHMAAPTQATRLVSTALDLLHEQACVVVLDGLEVIQESLDLVQHGSFLDPQLERFLDGFCEANTQSVVVLTSRFVFADLERHLGTTSHQLELRGLKSEDGGRLLAELGVGGSIADRINISERLDGHPLALRLFAEVLPEDCRVQPCCFLEHAFESGNVTYESPLGDRVRRLLVFYEAKLPDLERQLLSVVALFRGPVSDEMIVRLVRGLFGVNTDRSQDAEIVEHLQKMIARGVLSREPLGDGGRGTACHPILRDHFRELLLNSLPSVKGAASLLTDAPSTGTPCQLSDIQPVVAALEILVDAGDFRSAKQLYDFRLARGQVFRSLLAPTEGLACAIKFVRDETARQRCEKQISRQQVHFFCNEVAGFAWMGGQYKLAAKYLEDSIAIVRSLGQPNCILTGLKNQANFHAHFGRLDQGRRAATEAFEIAETQRNFGEMCISLSLLGWIELMAGQSTAGLGFFARANLLDKGRSEDVEDRVIHQAFWAEFLIRTSNATAGLYAAELGLKICERQNWGHDLPVLQLVAGWAALETSQVERAQSILEVAEVGLRRGLPLENARAQVILGELALAKGDPSAAMRRSEEALAWAASRGIRFLHADALILRGRARLLERAILSRGRAFDDAEEAIHLARECGYAWAERDGLYLEAAASNESADAATTADPSTRRVAPGRPDLEADALASQLRIAPNKLISAEAEAAKWLESWKKSH